MEEIQRHKIPNEMNPRDVTYSMAAIVNNTLLHI